MARQDVRVEELVSMIDRGELRLPEMQRQYVWQSTRVRDLMDSLYRGYPSGAILVWDTDEDVALRDFAVEQAASPYKRTRLLLDGQQRLTSLSAVIQGKHVSVRNRKRPIELLFNLEHPEHTIVVSEDYDSVEGEDEREDDEVLEADEGDEDDASEDEILKRFENMTFVVAARKLEQMPHWVKVSEVFRSNSDTPFLLRAGITELGDPRGEKYSKRLAKLRNIRNYYYRMDILERTMSYNEVTEIFVRVNSLGAKLRSSDLALAQITAKWKNSLKIFTDFQSECAKKDFYLDLGIHLKNLVVFATGQSRFQTVNSLSVEALQAAWKQACDGMRFAMNFVINNVGIDSPILLSSPFLLIVLAYYGHKKDYSITIDEERQLRYWSLIANAKGRFSRGSSETILDQDLNGIGKGGTIAEMLDRIRAQVGLLEITSQELDGRNQRSALFKTMFLAFKKAGAKDWESNVAIALDHSGNQHRLQFHHIFPKAYLRENSFSSREADDIANMAFIGGRTNRRIRDKAPSLYLPPIIDKSGSDPFTVQCIPVQQALLDATGYKAFLAERRQLIAKALNDFIGASG